MVLAIDIGNTYISLALFDPQGMSKAVSFTTPKRITATEATDICGKYQSDVLAIASVVPMLTKPFLSAGLELGRETFELTHKSKTGLKFDYNDPSTIGADRIANAVAGLKQYQQDLIIIDFGTATTFDVVHKEGIYLGGVICPGIESSLEAMIRRAALIPSVELKPTDHIIGKNTAECIRSGIIYTTIGQLKELIAQIKKETEREYLVVATGGWAEEIKRLLPLIDVNNPDLTLKGIYESYLLNQQP